MPGHIKLVKGAVDPDPTEFLLPSMDMKKADQNKPYEPKKSVWVPGLSCSETNGYSLSWSKIAFLSQTRKPADTGRVSSSRVQRLPTLAPRMRTSPPSWSLQWVGFFDIPQ